MKRIVRVGAAVALFLSFGLGSSAWADDQKMLDVMLKKGIITQQEYDDLLKEAAEGPKPPAQSEPKPSVFDDLQNAIEAQKAADQQRAALDKQAIEEGKNKGWMGAVKDGFTPKDTEYQVAPASVMLLNLHRSERLGFHLHNIQMQYYDQPHQAGATGTNNSQFKINTAELEGSGYLLPGLLYAQVVVDARDTAGRGLGDSIAKNIPPGNNAPQGILRDAFVDLMVKGEEAFVRVGESRVPFGIEAQTFGGLLPFINRAFIDSKVTRNASSVFGADVNRYSNAEFVQERDLGIQFRGHLGEGMFTYGLGFYNGAGINVNDTNSSKDFIGRLGFNPHPGLRFGFSAYQGTQVDIQQSSGVRNRLGGDFEITHDLVPRLHIMGEMADGRDEHIHRFTYYVQAMFEVMPQGTPTAPMLLVKARYDELRDNLGVGDNNYIRRTYGVDYFFLNGVKIASGFWQQIKLQVDYEMRSHTAATVAIPSLYLEDLSCSLSVEGDGHLLFFSWL